MGRRTVFDRGIGMKIVDQSWEFHTAPDGMELLKSIECAGRICYKSDVTENSAKERVKKWIDIGHHSVIEHGAISVKIITDRGVTHELVRHRLASYSMESTRYCNYSKDKFGNEIKVILPVRFYDIYATILETGEPIDLDSDGMLEQYGDRWMRFCGWHDALCDAETNYLHDLKLGGSPQEARDMLPNSLKTEIVMTANPREWRHVFTLRTSLKAHPQIRALMIDMLTTFKDVFPVLFDDIGEGT